MTMIEARKSKRKMAVAPHDDTDPKLVASVS